MAYSTAELVRNALTPTGVGGTAAVLPDSQLVDAIEEADQLIDSYIGARYAVPVQPVSGATPPPVGSWSRDIAAYLATLTWRRSQDITDNDPVVRRYKMTLQALTDVRDGKNSLPLPSSDGQTQDASGAGPVINRYVGNLFTVRDFDLYPDRLNWQQNEIGRW